MVTKMRKYVEATIFVIFILSATVGLYHLCKKAHHHCKDHSFTASDYRDCMGI